MESTTLSRETTCMCHTSSKLIISICTLAPFLAQPKNKNNGCCKSTIIYIQWCMYVVQPCKANKRNSLINLAIELYEDSYIHISTVHGHEEKKLDQKTI